MHTPREPTRRTRPAHIALLALAFVLLVLGEIGHRRLRATGWTAHEGQGLPYTQIDALAAGPDGALWAGTRYGLARYDGTAWATYTTRHGMPDDAVAAVAVSPSGDVWLNAGGTCVQFDGQTWRRHRDLELLLDNHRGSGSGGGWSVAVAPDGTLWFGARGGVIHYRGRGVPVWTAYGTARDLPDAPIMAIAAGADGSIWAGTRRGALRYDGAAWTAHTRRDGLAGSVRAVAVGRDGVTWAATARGLASLSHPGARWTTRPYPPGMDGAPLALAIDGTGRVWAGTRGGIQVWQPGAGAPAWALHAWSYARAALLAAALGLAIAAAHDTSWGQQLAQRRAGWVAAQRARLAAFHPRAILAGWVAARAAAWLRWHAQARQALRRQRQILLALALITALALSLRLWQLDYDLMLPYVAHADEQTQYNPAIHIIQTGNLNPHFFNYPSLAIYVDTAALYLGYRIGALSGAFDSPADLQPIRTVGYARGRVETPALLLVGRATTAVFGALTAGLVFALASALVQQRKPLRPRRAASRAAPNGPRQVAGRVWMALLAALILALSVEHIRLSHYMTVDVIATFFATACVVACTCYLARGERRALWLASLCGGLATSTKYNYAVLAIPVALSVFLDQRLWGHQQLRLLSLSGVLFVAAFLLTSPYVLLDAAAAFDDIQFEMRHYATGHLGQSGSSTGAYLRTLWQDNPLLLLLGIPGLAIALRRVGRIALPAATFAGLYFLLLGIQTVHMGRNVLPVMAILGACIPVPLVALYDALPARLRRPRLRTGARGIPVLAILLGALALLPALYGARTVLRHPQPSGQAQAQAWFDRALQSPAGARYMEKDAADPLRIAAEGYTVYLDPRQVDITYLPTVTEVGPPEAFRARGYDIVLLGAGMYSRFYAGAGVFPQEVRIYDAFLALPEQMTFQGPPNPISFVSGGARVHVVYLTPRALQFRDAVQAEVAEARTAMRAGLSISEDPISLSRTISRPRVEPVSAP